MDPIAPIHRPNVRWRALHWLLLAVVLISLLGKGVAVYCYQNGIQWQFVTDWKLIARGQFVHIQTIPDTPHHLRDYWRWYEAARRVWDNEPLANPPDQPGSASFLKFPPAFAVYVAPLGLLPYNLYVAVWYLLSVACGAAAILLAMKIVYGRWAPANPLMWFLPLLGTFRFFWDDIHSGNIHMVLLAMLMLGAYFVCRRRNWAGGLAVAMAITWKAFPVVLLGPAVVQRRWKFAAWTLAGIVLWTLVVPAAVRGPGRQWQETSAWFTRIVSPYAKEDPNQPRTWDFKDRSNRNQTFYSLVWRLFRPVDIETGQEPNSPIGAAASEAEGPAKSSAEPATSPATAAVEAKSPARALAAATTSVSADNPPAKKVKFRRMNLATLPKPFVQWIFLALALAASIAVAGVCLRKRPPGAGGIDVIDLAIAMNFILVVTPIAWDYFYTLLLLPMCIGAKELLAPASPGRQKLFLIVWLLTAALTAGGAVNAWLKAFAAIPLMSLMWFVTMLVLRNRPAEARS